MFPSLTKSKNYESNNSPNTNIIQSQPENQNNDYHTSNNKINIVSATGTPKFPNIFVHEETPRFPQQSDITDNTLTPSKPTESKILSPRYKINMARGFFFINDNIFF